MVRKVLSHKPLVEAIFEMRWELQEPSVGIRIDPNYKILIGSIYEKVRDKGTFKYPFYEQLPTANIPDEMAGYVIQYRFRKEESGWPLIQIGPGIVTLNDTEDYDWSDFKERILHVVEVLFDSYPDAKHILKLNGLSLRYINAIDFDYKGENIFSFLENNLKVKIDISQKLFVGTGVNNVPSGFDLRFSFPSMQPEGTIHLRFVKGKKKDNIDALIWETQVQSIGDEVSNEKDWVIDWANQAHDLAIDWFFKMIEGELLRRFE